MIRGGWVGGWGLSGKWEVENPEEDFEGGCTGGEVDGGFGVEVWFAEEGVRGQVVGGGCEECANLLLRFHGLDSGCVKCVDCCL